MLKASSFIRKSYSAVGRRLSLAATERAVPVLDRARCYKIGDEVHGYTVEQVAEIPDFHSVAVKLRHNNTGAEHLHLARDDQNNVFSVSFRTTPMDSSGVPHILEHTTLCGSKKFPCRDPFFKMLNRSLSTFMNAWTASDYTMYPFSTQNGKDFSNLLSVYLDAVFFPNLHELDFWQEGWRLEHEVTEDRSSPIIFKGVVFNEMKGALSTAEAVFGTRLQNLILPSHTYGFISGGDPLVIPNLTWEQLKEFHATHYHPSNAKFYTYGDLDLQQHLQSIDSLALKHFSRIEPGTEIPAEPKWTVPREASITCPPDPLAANPEKQTMASVSFMLDSISDPFMSFTMGILSALLVSGPNAPFYQSLIEPNIGSDYSPGVGFDGSTKNPTFSIGLQGLASADVPKVVEIVQETFKKAAKEGFEDERIASILHRIEVAQKHQSSNFGLGMIASLMSSWNQDNNPIDRLEIDKHVQRFKDELAKNENFLQEKVRELFIENPHKLTLVMSPEEDFKVKREEKERALLRAKVEQLRDSDKQEIYEKGLQLLKQQSEPSDVSCLPKMNVADIDRKGKTTTADHEIIEGVKLQIAEQPTNGITYFRAMVNVSSLPYILKPYLPLFCHVLTKMGAGGRNYRELAQEVEMYTGGLGVSTHLATNTNDVDKFEQGVLFSSHCLDRNLPQMFSLWQDIFVEPFLRDKDRLRTLVNALASDLAMSIPDSGHMYALAAASGSLTPSARLGELFGGLTQIHFMKEMAEQGTLDQLINNLIQIAYHVLNINDVRCALNVAPESRLAATNSFANFLESINNNAGDEMESDTMPFKPRTSKQFIQMPFPVNYVSRCIRTVPYCHPDSPKLRILAKLLSAKFLHREIREKGGAYGSGARFGGGIFGFFSYRDPNTGITLQTFEDSLSWAAQGNFSEDDIEEAKLSVFSVVDSPISPANKGMVLFTDGITDEMRQLHRDGLFRVGKDDLVDVAERYLRSGSRVEASAIIGAEAKDFVADNSWTIKKETIDAIVP